MKRLGCLFFLYLACFTSAAGARESITSYDVDITVLRSGGLEIVETIEVYATGDDIKRGIFREFPRGIWNLIKELIPTPSLR